MTLAADTTIIVLEGISLDMGMEEHFRILVLDGDRVIVADLFLTDVRSYSRLEKLTGMPWLLKRRSLPNRVSWNSGLMKVSPGPDCVRMAKWT
jgi:hypothetical protein